MEPRSILLKVLRAAAMLIIGSIFLVFLIYGIGTSISCDYMPLALDEKAPDALPVGTRLAVRTELIGMLNQSIDHAQVYFLSITPPPGYSNRFVSRRVPIPIGTIFRVIGFRRPHNPICYGYEWKVILEAEKPINGSGDEIQMGIETAKNPSFMVRN